MSGLFSTRCRKCDHEYVLGVVKSIQPPAVGRIQFCVHCGSSNIVVQEEKNVLKIKENPCADPTLMPRPMTAAELTELNREINENFWK